MGGKGSLESDLNKIAYDPAPWNFVASCYKVLDTLNTDSPKLRTYRITNG
jgi:hypothetical protein